MNCPVCHVGMKSKLYSDNRLFECDKCRGHLVEQFRMNKIQRRINKDLIGLIKESVEADSHDTDQHLRCPRCRNRMDKKFVRGGLSFHVDECRNCKFVWLDGGELAEIQLDYENNAQTSELNKMRERLATMTRQEREEYEARIASLKSGDTIRTSMSEITHELALIYYFLS